MSNGTHIADGVVVVQACQPQPEATGLRVGVTEAKERRVARSVMRDTVRETVHLLREDAISEGKFLEALLLIFQAVFRTG